MAKGLPKNEKWYTGTLTGSPQTAAMLGELSAAWAFLEHALVDVLAHTLKISRSASEAILFAINNSATKLDIVESVALRRASEPLRGRLLKAVEMAKAAAKRRNIYVHHLIGYDDHGRLCRWDYREPADTQARRVIFRIEDIDDLIMEIRETSNAFQYAVHPEIGPPPPLPRTPRKPLSAPKRGKGRGAQSDEQGPPTLRRPYPE